MPGGGCHSGDGAEQKLADCGQNALAWESQRQRTDPIEAVMLLAR